MFLVPPPLPMYCLNCTATYCRYRDIFESLLSRGMTPNVTLHHFTAPQWFMEIGGWERAENIPLFVEYAVKVSLTVFDYQF